jgi:hypothetical protein
MYTNAYTKEATHSVLYYSVVLVDSTNNLAVAAILNSPYPVSHYRLLNVEFKVNEGL